MAAPASESTMLSKCMQGGLLLAMPATLVAAGGPQTIWHNHGWIVRTVLVANTLPAAVCSLGLAEDLYRAIDILVKERFAGRSVLNNAEFQHEIKRVAGFARAIALPINGWGVLVKLPVKDHFVYAIPIKAAKILGKKSLDIMIQTAIRVDRFMQDYHLYKAIEILYKCTLKYPLKGLKAVVVGAGTVISAALGFARDLITKR